MKLHEWMAGWSGWIWPLFANHLWQATLFATLAFIAVLLIRRGPSRVRYAIWAIAGLKFALPSAALALLIAAAGFDLSARPPSMEQRADTFAAVSQFAVPVRQSSNVVLSETKSAGHSEVYCALSLAWLSGVAILFGLWAMQRRRLSLALRDGRVVTGGRELESLRRARSMSGTTRTVGLIVSPRIVEPGVWGSLRPAILLPEGIADELSDAELEAVLLHELIHVARWDNLVSNLHKMLCCLFWFHPLMWFIDSRLLNERERACDDAVIRLGGGSGVYASSLLKVLKFCLGWRVAGVSFAAGSNLGRRVERIMGNDSDRKLRISHRVVLGTVAAVVVVFSIAAGLVSREHVAAQESGVQAGDLEAVSLDDVDIGESQEAKRVYNLVTWRPARKLEFRNEAGSPVSITEASVQFVRISQRRGNKADAADEPVTTYFIKPRLKLVSNSERLIGAVALEFTAPNGSTKVYVEKVYNSVAPHDSFALNTKPVRLDGSKGNSLADSVNSSAPVVKVIGVLFKDGTSWGEVPPPPPPPPPPKPRRAKDLPPPPPPPTPKP